MYVFKKGTLFKKGMPPTEIEKIVRLLVLPLELFQDDLQCTLMIPVLLPFILRTILFLNPSFEKF